MATQKYLFGRAPASAEARMPSPEEMPTASLARAIEISRSCPVLAMPGASVEVREMAGSGY